VTTRGFSGYADREQSSEIGWALIVVGVMTSLHEGCLVTLINARPYYHALQHADPSPALADCHACTACLHLLAGRIRGAFTQQHAISSGSFMRRLGCACRCRPRRRCSHTGRSANCRRRRTARELAKSGRPLIAIVVGVAGLVIFACALRFISGALGRSANRAASSLSHLCCTGRLDDSPHSHLQVNLVDALYSPTGCRRVSYFFCL